MLPAADFDAVLKLLVALTGGAAIGLERTYHGRPAGFRTYALVCLGSALLIIYGDTLAGSDPAAASRIAQGIMTGIGFLGAGVIFKERLSVHGLTTAASIWASAGLGILIGAGAWVPAAMSWAAILVTLSVLRWIEDRFPHQVFVHLLMRFAEDAAPGQDEIRALLHQSGFRPGRVSLRLDEMTRLLEYRMTAFCFAPERANETLAARLRATPGLEGFEIMPSDD